MQEPTGLPNGIRGLPEVQLNQANNAVWLAIMLHASGADISAFERECAVCVALPEGSIWPAKKALQQDPDVMRFLECALKVQGLFDGTLKAQATSYDG